MITTKLILQSILGLGAIAGAAGGGYMFMGNSEDYFLVTSVATTPTVKSADLVQESAKDNFITNYTCISAESVNQQTDPNCVIYSIDFDDAKKSIDINSINKKIKNLNGEDDTKKLKKITDKTKLAEKKFLLLKASSSLYEKWKFDGTQKINLLSQDAKQESFATLTVHGKITDNTVEGNVDFVVVKSGTDTTQLTTTDTSKTYKCKFKDEDEGTSCSLYTFSTATLGNSQTLLDLPWTSFVISPTNQTATTIAANNYYFIKWEGKTTHELNAQETLIFVEDSADNTKKATFDIKSAIFGIFDTDNKEAILLKTNL